jgi:hypothetical protein
VFNGAFFQSIERCYEKQNELGRTGRLSLYGSSNNFPGPAPRDHSSCPWPTSPLFPRGGSLTTTPHLDPHLKDVLMFQPAGARTWRGFKPSVRSGPLQLWIGSARYEDWSTGGSPAVFPTIFDLQHFNSACAAGGIGSRQ